MEQTQTQNRIQISGWITKHHTIGYEFYDKEPKLYSNPPFFRSPESSCYFKIPDAQTWELPVEVRTMQAPARKQVVLSMEVSIEDIPAMEEVE